MKHTTPSDIERTSMEIISAELEARGIDPPPENAPIVRRVIHATADFDYARSLTFTPCAVERFTALLKTGIPIVTDTNMAKAGISSAALSRWGNEVFCFMSDPETARAAADGKTTRAAVSMQLAARRFPNALFVIGNAPTALMALSALAAQGYRPAGIVGVPVGFVNVVESKEETLKLCQSLEIPGIFAMGRKGGSTVAAAICNALLYTASDMLDPSRRGWH